MNTVNGPAFLVAGFVGLFAGAMVQDQLNGKPFSFTYFLAMIVVTAAELIWIASMFRQAALPDDSDFPTGKTERYIRPVGSAATFVVSFLIPIVSGFR